MQLFLNETKVPIKNFSELKKSMFVHFEFKDEIFELLSGLLQPNPWKRRHAEDLLKLPIFSYVRQVLYEKEQMEVVKDVFLSKVKK